jgi:hypothetical protein
MMEQLSKLESKYPKLTEGANKFGEAWKKTLDTPQQKLHNLEQGAQALAITAGDVLMPAASGILGGLNKAMSWIQGNAFASKGLALGAGTLVAGGLAKGLFSGVEAGLSGIGKVGSVLKIPGMDKLAGLGQGAGLNGAAASLDGAAARLSAAAAELSGSAGKLGAGAAGGAGKGGVPIPGGAPAGAGAAENAAERTAPFSLGMFTPVGIGIAGGIFAALYANQFRYTEHPAPAGQLGPRSYGSPASAAGSQAWKQYDAAPPAIGQQFTNTLARAMGKPVKLPPPDISALTGAKGKAQADAKAIQTSIEQALHKKVKATPPDLSAYQAAAGKAKADGAHISAGLAAGIEAGKGAAVAAANDVANAVAGAMARALQTRSPSRVTHKIGKDASAGLVLGLEGGKAAVDAAAAALGRNAAKAADIASIDSTVKKMLAQVPHGDTGLTRMLRGDQAKLTSLANQRSRLEQEITNAQDIAKNAISAANITGAGTYEPVLAAAGGPLSSFATIAGMKNMAADQAQFASVIGQLKKQGLNAASLTQIAQAGPQALPMALGLAQGGKGAIAQVNQLEGQIHASAARLGNTAAGPMYQAGVAAGQGLAAGIRSQLGAVESAMKQLANAMVGAVKKHLKSHSPSLVMRDIGIGLPQGLAMGVDAGSAAAEASVRRMGQRAAGAFHPGYAHGGGYGGRGGGGTVHYHYNVTVQGHVTTEHDLLSKLQELHLTRTNNNWQSGWSLPGRKT